MLALAALRVPRYLFRAYIAVVAVSLTVIVAAPEKHNALALAAVAVPVSVAAVGVFVALLRRGDRVALFLAGWFAWELIGYFGLTPFGAARRVLSLMTVTVFLCGRLVEIKQLTAVDLARLRGTAVFGVSLGLFFGVVDLIDAYPEKTAAEDVAAWVRSQPGGDAEIWFAGHWGFQYYARVNGMKTILPGDSVVPKGSWVVLPDEKAVPRPVSQTVQINPEELQWMRRMETTLPLPVRTNPPFYGGHTPMVRHHGARVSLRVYRAKVEWRPQVCWQDCDKSDEDAGPSPDG